MFIQKILITMFILGVSGSAMSGAAFAKARPVGGCSGSPAASSGLGLPAAFLCQAFSAPHVPRSKICINPAYCGGGTAQPRVVHRKGIR